MDPRIRPVIVLRATELWRYRKLGRLGWLREERERLDQECRDAARSFARQNAPRWALLPEPERERVCTSIFEALFRDQATAAFVERLLPRPVSAYVAEAVAEALGTSAADPRADS